MLYSGLYHPSGSQSENQRKWKERQVLRLSRRTKKKTMEHEGDGDTNCN